MASDNLSPPQHPTIEDGSALWRIASQTPGIDANSPYYYLLWCRDFAQTSILIRNHTEIAAFTTAYIRPSEPDTLVVWQQIVRPDYRGRQLGFRMVDHLLRENIRDNHIKNIEATVTAFESAPVHTLRKIAAQHGAELTKRVLFDRQAFPVSDHDPELLIRVGPLREVSVSNFKEAS